MNKSKFKSAKYLPFNLTLIPKSFFNNHFWESIGGINDASEFIRFQESTIEQHPELFEVEKAEREFEEGAYYKVRFQGRLNYEVALCRINETNGLFTFTIPDYKPQYKEAFQEIGDKIELKNEL